VGSSRKQQNAVAAQGRVGTYGMAGTRTSKDSANSAHSSLVRKLRRSFCLGRKTEHAMCCMSLQGAAAATQSPERGAAKQVCPPLAEGLDAGVPVAHDLGETRVVTQGVKIGIDAGPPEVVIAPLNGSTQPVKSLFSITA
jgi:hypothetical protein